MQAGQLGISLTLAMSDALFYTIAVAGIISGLGAIFLYNKRYP